MSLSTGWRCPLPTKDNCDQINGRKITRPIFFLNFCLSCWLPPHRSCLDDDPLFVHDRGSGEQEIHNYKSFFQCPSPSPFPILLLKILIVCFLLLLLLNAHSVTSKSCSRGYTSTYFISVLIWQSIYIILLYMSDAISCPRHTRMVGRVGSYQEDYYYTYLNKLKLAIQCTYPHLSNCDQRITAHFSTETLLDIILGCLKHLKVCTTNIGGRWC